ncbi:hypothetical protein ACLMJK_006532 [Lecanora helva]
MDPEGLDPSFMMASPNTNIDNTTPLKPLPTAVEPPSASNVTTSRPEALRRATAPDTPSIQLPSATPHTQTLSLPLRPRTRSPFTRGHARSRSSNGSISAPQMTRAHSSPNPNISRPYITRPSSPLGYHSRHGSPMRKPLEEAFSSFGGGLDIDQTISENSELDLTPKAAADLESSPSSPSPYPYSTFPRSRRRPASPLHQIIQPATATYSPSHNLRACISTPSLAASHYNEAYPTTYAASSGSIPSTPTSLRSRSPSISSLETIPDSPDAEEEAEKIAKLKAAADREDQSEEGVRRRLAADAGRGSKGDKRKRWSVCGAERRGDLSLETIWEG